MDKTEAVAVIDFEFLSANPHGLCDPKTAVTSIGAFFFRPVCKEFVDRNNGFYAQLDLDPQFALGRTVSKSTLYWWAGQPGFQKELDGPIHPRDALTGFAQWLVQYDIKKIYAAPLQVDGPILVDLALAYDVKLPIIYNSMRCVHSVVDMVGYKNIPERPFIHDAHDAGSDAKNSAWLLYNAMKMLS